jgi:hypothetical protein
MNSQTALHIGADVLETPRRAVWPRLRSCRDSVERLTQLCTAAGITTQRRLLGIDATLGQVRAAIAEQAAHTRPGGLFVLTFSGHSERAVPGEHDGGWCLRDGTLQHTDTADILLAAPPSAHLLVIADTCYAASFATVLTRLPATTVLLAACAANQGILDYPVSMFVTALQRLTFPDGMANPANTSYAWLRQQLRNDTPDVERPDICTNRPHAWHWRPFQRAARAAAERTGTPTPR